MAFGLLRVSDNPRFQQLFGTDDNTLLPLPLFAAALAATVAVGWLLYATRTRWVLPDGSEWSPGYVTAEMPPASLGAVTEGAVPRAGGVVAVAAVYVLFVGVLAWELVVAWRAAG